MNILSENDHDEIVIACGCHVKQNNKTIFAQFSALLIQIAHHNVKTIFK